MAYKLAVESREGKKTGRALRREGYIPATVYGPEIEAQNLLVVEKDFKKIPLAEYNHIIELAVSGNDAYDVLMKHVQKDFVSGAVQNIEFYKTKKGHKVNTKVVIKFVGDSEAVKMGADLVTMHKEVHVRCIPRKIPQLVEVDLSLLKEVDDHITFGTLKLDEEVEILDPLEEVICKAEAKRVAAAEPTTTEAAEGEAAEGEAKEGEAKAEGEKKE